MLQKLSALLDHFSYSLDLPETHPRQAAVLIALTREADPQVLLTLRSTHLKRHSGEVSFPGGWWEPGDETLADTALREAHEEVGLAPENVEVLGTWRSRYARGGIRVQPVVGVISPDLPLTASPDELDAVFKVPVSFFLQDPRLRTDVFTRDGVEQWAPAYQFGEFEIWGFTAGMLVDLLNKTLDARIGRLHPSAPERRY
ncbi:CoA pyrophosphatase [Simiduia sp. 21SJ11W-1]|uniref:CoA pyrophosphatase n=1 Tax=Simiduia sp. 21SJ11W-1 TaxID=2909669 RepID=UPI00209DBE9C|nr:CoA pyrophosphatase [Simiduia sp. 21SJ11W-1]UTA46319.1 CoA pyrophosphatase [Simiduia sp. 21SJ11W-1]